MTSSKENNQFDVIVLGLGAMGSASTYHLAKSGLRVLGLDRFAPPHRFGSSTGETRIIREAYFEHPSYVPLVQRAYQLWNELEKASGETLFIQTGGLMVGPKNGTVFQGSLHSARTHKLSYEILDREPVKKRFPQFQLTTEMQGIFEPRAGLLFPEKCIATHLQQALAHGAVLKTDTTLLHWEQRGDSISVTTTAGQFQCQDLVISAGAWLSELTPDLKIPFTIERQVQFWFEPASTPDLWKKAICPVYLCETEHQQFWYGFPDLGDGIKVARHHGGRTVNPNEAARDEEPADEPAMREVVQKYIPSANGRKIRSRVCLYTNTPDGHFLLDRHPCAPNVLLVSPCSGHGFKFSSAIGEVVKQLVVDGSASFDLSLFQWRW